DATALSFFPSKNLGAYGDAGMILTNDDRLAKRMKSLRVHGANPKYYHQEVGYNSRLDAIQASILRVKLQYLNQWTKGRQRVAATYLKLLNKYNLRNKIVTPEYKVQDSIHVYHQYVIRVDNRDEFQEKLKKAGISTAVYYPIPLHLQECYQKVEDVKDFLPVAEKACKEVLALPIDPGLSEKQVDYVVKCIKENVS
ncbi:MAG: DegT/DnrJ/EryC1/StrS family aminotransferase, partial [bacterium]